MEDKTPDLRLLEPASPESLLPDAGTPVWLFVLIALLLLGFIAWLIIRKKAAKGSTQIINRRNQAYARAIASIKEIKVEHARHAAIQISLILRRYLADATNDPALFETHEEYVARRDSLQRLNDDTRRACDEGFQKLAKLKYAPEIPNIDPQSVVSEGEELLEIIHGGFRP